MPWYVLITKPKAEKKVYDRLLHLGFAVCMPTKIEHKKWSDRIKKVETPLLPSMVLVNTSEKERNNVFDVPGVVRYLFWLGKPSIVSKEEVDVLVNINHNKTHVEEVKALKEGDTIEIKNLGSEKQPGVIKKITGNTCWITLKSLGSTIKIKV